MRRRLFNFAAAVSLLLCLGTVALRLRSCSCFDYACGTGGRTRLIGLSGAGELQFCLMRYDHERLDMTFRREVFHDEDLQTPVLRYSEYTLHHDGLTLPIGERSLLPRIEVEIYAAASPTFQDYSVSLPYWAIATVFSFVPAVWLYRNHRQSKNIAMNRCGECSYNLTGNTSGVCPECGTAVAGKVGVKA